MIILIDNLFIDEIKKEIKNGSILATFFMNTKNIIQEALNYSNIIIILNKMNRELENEIKEPFLTFEYDSDDELCIGRMEDYVQIKF